MRRESETELGKLLMLLLLVLIGGGLLLIHQTGTGFVIAIGMLLIFFIGAFVYYFKKEVLD